MVTNWLRAWKNYVPGTSRPRHARKPARRNPGLLLEALEDRLAPAVLTVNSTADDAALALDSLRAAIASIEHHADANANIRRAGSYGNHDTIQFNLAAGQRTITLTSNDHNMAFGPTGLVITSDMILDGTQDGVTISGNNARRVFAVANGVTLTLQRLTVSGGRAQGGSRFRFGTGRPYCLSNQSPEQNTKPHEGGQSMTFVPGKKPDQPNTPVHSAPGGHRIQAQPVSQFLPAIPPRVVQSTGDPIKDNAIRLDHIERQQQVLLQLLQTVSSRVEFCYMVSQMMQRNLHRK
jgi:hypothetical protein